MRNRLKRIMKGALLCTMTAMIFGCASTATTMMARQEGVGDAHVWPAYDPDINYQFNEEAPEVQPPTKILDDCENVVETITSEWWCFRYGPDKNPLVTAAAWEPMLKRLDEESAYFRDVMGWPPDKRARNGYYSAVYLFGSGLSTDKADNQALGGWMGSIRHEGENWPMIIASYYPVYAFDPAFGKKDKEYQCGGMVHEGVHAILAGMPGCKKAGWFHEGGNNWLQAVANAQRKNDFSSMGWLSAGAMIAPFMPIECYSGWLQDGSFGGPSAEGVNRYEKIDGERKQLCTWRKLLGGTQYGESFPIFLGEIVSPGAVAWIWQNCAGRVLEGLATVEGGLGNEQTRRLIKEYRARQAMCDFGRWSEAYKDLLHSAWGVEFKAEAPPVWIECEPWIATCYAATTREGNTLTPEQRTLPGWSGANQIPLTVSGEGLVEVDFQPIGADMSCQLVYRTEDGSVVYSKPVDGGACRIYLDKPVKNNVVIAVVSNTDYVFEGDETRKKKYDYRLSLGSGITDTADIHTKWWE